MYGPLLRGSSTDLSCNCVLFRRIYLRTVFGSVKTARLTMMDLSPNQNKTVVVTSLCGRSAVSHGNRLQLAHIGFAGVVIGVMGSGRFQDVLQHDSL